MLSDSHNIDLFGAKSLQSLPVPLGEWVTDHHLVADDSTKTFIR